MLKKFRGKIINTATLGTVLLVGINAYAVNIDISSVDMKVNGKPAAINSENNRSTGSSVNDTWNSIFGDKGLEDITADDIVDAQNKQQEETVKTNGADARAGRKYKSDDPVYLKSNFLPMRKEMEKLFNSEVYSDGGYGDLYQVNFFGDVKAFDNPSYRGAFIQDMNYGITSYKDGLKQLASKSFTDIKGTEWYADKIPSAVYYGLINGLPDGTFAGNKSVTRAEFGVMLLNYENEMSEANYNSTVYPQFTGKWYNKAVGTIDKGLISMSKIDESHINKGMTRGEIAYMLANRYFLGDYTKALAKVNSGSYNKNLFSDIKTVKGSTEELRNKDNGENGNVLIKYYNERCQNGSQAPKDIMAALMVMNELGIIKGDDLGRSNWNKPVTRAEAVVIFNNVSQIH